MQKLFGENVEIENEEQTWNLINFHNMKRWNSINLVVKIISVEMILKDGA